MATHEQNIQNLRDAVLGEQVRGSMIELFNEDYDRVKKSVGIGTAVSAPTSSITGYYDGNLYINSSTMDIWQMDGYGWVKVGNLKTISATTSTESSEDDGYNVITFSFTDGTSKAVNIKNGSKGSTGVSITGVVDNGDGTFYLTMSNGSRTGNIATIRGLKGDKGDKGQTGDTGETGRGITNVTMTGTGKSHPINVYYTDGSSQLIGMVQDGADGNAGGDMFKATYDPDDNGYVSYAGALTDGSVTIPAATVANKADKATTLAGYGITNAYTKTEVDEMIDTASVDWDSLTGKPFDSVSTDFGVTNDVLSLSSTTKNYLSVALTSDKYSGAKTYSKDDLCISNNVVYKSKVNNNLNNAVTNTTYWESTTIGGEIGNLKQTLTNQIINISKENSNISDDWSVQCVRNGNVVLVVYSFTVSADINSTAVLFKNFPTPQYQTWFTLMGDTVSNNKTASIMVKDDTICAYYRTISAGKYTGSFIYICH